MLALDRMAIEEAGPNPERSAAAIHAQLALSSGSVPIHQIAEALDIVEIQQAPLKGLEGALVSSPERDIGLIVVNAASSVQRQRFTVAHELEHFLNPWHRPIEPSGLFACRPEDVRRSWRKLPPEASHHLIQEAEANRFAIELLAPEKFVRQFLRGMPDLASVLRLSKTLDLSREAGARRYVELHEQPSALVFSTDGVIRYVDRHPGFPFVLYRTGQRLPEVPPPGDETGLSAHEEADPRDWLARPPGRDGLVVQTLSQRRGFAITLLALDRAEPAEERRHRLTRADRNYSIGCLAAIRVLRSRPSLNPLQTSLLCGEFSLIAAGQLPVSASRELAGQQLDFAGKTGDLTRCLFSRIFPVFSLLFGNSPGDGFA
jgi:IrrE N-terminal-like domain